MADETNDKETNQDDADNFGLPDLEYKPLDQLDTSKPKEEQKSESEEESSNTSTSSGSTTSEAPTYYEEEEEGGSGSGVVIAIIVLLILGVGGFFFWKYVYLPKKQKQELATKQAEEREKAKADSIARVQEAERIRLEEEAKKNAKPAEGAIDTLSQRTGHYYVIIASAVDGDLVMDRAKKLSASGTSTKIIKPFGKWKFYRLGVGNFDTFASAQSSADASKGEYGDALWVLKY
ncbi:MAG: hypothetical protein QM734_13920 [Cyclobacteriaceae bacterium]